MKCSGITVVMMVAQPVNIQKKPTEPYTSKGSILWYVNYISVKKKNVFVNNNLSYLDRKITKQKYKKTIHTRQLKERRIRAVVYKSQIMCNNT